MSHSTVSYFVSVCRSVTKKEKTTTRAALRDKILYQTQRKHNRKTYKKLRQVYEHALSNVDDSRFKRPCTLKMNSYDHLKMFIPPKNVNSRMFFIILNFS